MKHTIKKIAAGATTLALASPLLAFAQVGGSAASNTAVNAAQANLSDASIGELLTTIMMWLLGLVGILSVIAFAISGVMYLTSAGNEDQAKTAKQTMVYAIIGVVVALIGLIVFMTVRSIMEGSV